MTRPRAVSKAMIIALRKPVGRLGAIAVSISCLFLAGSAAWAQENPLTLHFLAFPKQLKPEPVELLIGDGKTIKVETPGHELSPAYKVPSLSTIAVGKTEINEEGDSFFDVYGQAKPLGTKNQIILLIRKGPKSSDGFSVLPIDAVQSNFGGGSFFMMNASKLTVGGTLGKTKFGLKPGQRQLLEPEPSHEGNVCQVTLFYEREEGWKKFRDTRWSLSDKCRTLVFFYQDPESGRLGIAPIVDIL